MKSLLIADDHLMFGNAMAYMLSQLDPDVRVVAVGSVDQTFEQHDRRTHVRRRISEA